MLCSPRVDAERRGQRRQCQNLVLPSGTAKIGRTEYVIATNGSPDTIAGLNRIPLLTRNGVTTYISEVAHVRDGFSPQTNIVRQNGQRGC